MPYIQVQGESLYYAETCAPEARLAMVLVHGAGENHLIWPASLRRMEGMAVYALDLPGHGKSSGQGRTSVSDYAQVIAEFMTAVGVDRAVIGGHSMGGAIAQQFASDLPHRTAGLILVATGARLRVAPSILEGMTRDAAGTLDLITRLAWGPDTSEPMRQLGRAQLAEVEPKIIAGDYGACNAFDLIGSLGQIAAPTLVVGGTADQLTPPKYAAFLAEHIPGARLAMVQGAGHMVMLEQPELVARPVREFLDSLPK